MFGHFILMRHIITRVSFTKCFGRIIQLMLRICAGNAFVAGRNCDCKKEGKGGDYRFHLTEFRTSKV